MLRKDQMPEEEIIYAKEFPVLSRVLIVMDKILWDFSQNSYQNISLPFYTVHCSDYENAKIFQTIKRYYLRGESRINYGILDLWAVKKKRMVMPGW